MTNGKKLIVVGDSSFAEIACEYFTHDSPYEVVAFSVEQAFLKRPELMGRPVVPFEKLHELYNPAEHSIYVAAVYTQLNRLRSRLAAQSKERGYKLASYVSSKAFVWRNVPVGEHCFIFENNVVQPFCKIGNNVVLWSGNHIGHHSTIGDNCFISSHVVISGHVTVGNNTFIGVNSTLVNNIAIEKENWIGPGVTITRSTQVGEVYKPTNRGMPAEISAYELNKIER